MILTVFSTHPRNLHAPTTTLSMPAPLASLARPTLGAEGQAGAHQAASERASDRVSDQNCSSLRKEMEGGPCKISYARRTKLFWTQ